MFFHGLRSGWGAVCLFVALAGCANVHYEHAQGVVRNEHLVFGRIVLVRDGEGGAISVFGTPVNIAPLESTTEPLLVTEPFEKDGRFYWSLKPGLQLLNIVLHEPTDDIVRSCWTCPTSRVPITSEICSCAARSISAPSGPPMCGMSR